MVFQGCNLCKLSMLTNQMCQKYELTCTNSLGGHVSAGFLQAQL